LGVSAGSKEVSGRADGDIVSSGVGEAGGSSGSKGDVLRVVKLKELDGVVNESVRIFEGIGRIEGRRAQRR
jgi:hypothetical protein